MRDYIHVVDLADAHVKGIKWLESCQSALVEKVNIGSGKGTSVLEVINSFEEISELKLNWKFGDRRAGDVVEIFADVRKSFQLLKWKANKTAKDAIIDAWNWELKLKND